MTTSYTEKEMADSFAEILRSPKGLPTIGSFNGVFREVDCRQGRPDFIAVRNKANYEPPNLPDNLGYVGSALLATLKPSSPRTIDYLVEHSEFSEQSVKRTLNLLVASTHVQRNDQGNYHLSPAVANRQVEIWAFELKLDNPRRAVYQAQCCCAYAHHTLIVVPPGKEKGYGRFDPTLTRWGIGLATFDPIEKEFCVTRRGTLSRTICPQHQIYTLAQIGI